MILVGQAVSYLYYESGVSQDCNIRIDIVFAAVSVFWMLYRFFYLKEEQRIILPLWRNTRSFSGRPEKFRLRTKAALFNGAEAGENIIPERLRNNGDSRGYGYFRDGFLRGSRQTQFLKFIA